MLAQMTYYASIYARMLLVPNYAQNYASIIRNALPSEQGMLII